MKVLIIGASSYVGARLYFDLKDKFEIIGTYNNNQFSKSFIKLDVVNKDDVSKLLQKIQPEVVIHVANYPSPKSAINNEENFIKLNDNGTINIVECTNKAHAKLIFISSQAANNATDIYGKLKAKSEKLIKTVKSGYLILRPSMIVGFSPNTKNPRPFNRILRCLDDKKTVGVFDTSWKLQPTYVGHLSQTIKKVIDQNLWNKTIPVFIDKLVTQYQIAKDILHTFDVKVEKTDMQMDIPPSKDSLEEFNSFNFFPRTYEEMIDVILREIKNRDNFIL